MTHDTLTKLLTARHSCRAYRSDEVPREVIGQVLKAAQRVPSWCNAQPWQVHVTNKAETTRLAEALYAEAMKGGVMPPPTYPSHRPIPALTRTVAAPAAGSFMRPSECRKAIAPPPPAR